MILFFVSLTTYFIYLCLKYRKSFYMLQQNSYNLSFKYIKWVFKNPSKTYYTYELSFILPFILMFFTSTKIVAIINITTYTIYSYLELKKLEQEQNKKKFVFTKRVRRLALTTLVFFSLIILLIYFNYSDLNSFINLKYYYLILFLFGYFSFLIAALVNFLNQPIEKCVYFYYKNKALTKIKSINDLKIIGITGSYGKTSSKNILHAVLSSDFNSYPSPKSYNTPYGLMNAINNGLDKFDNVFIAEMGATKVKDIKELCNFIHPKYGILTTIGVAHLETFKTEQNIINEKFELIESLPGNGIGILNKDDPKQVSYQLKNNCKIVWIGIDQDANVRASDIELSNKGTKFKITFKDKNETYEFFTPLLGKHNIYNILAAIALGYELGVKIDKLINAVKILTPTEHRLELKKYGDVNIIDDAFNSNPTGSKMALEVLDLMPGKKIIVTPGMIELGDKEYDYNKAFGTYIADVCDEVILIGAKQTKPIYDGLKEKKYPEKHIHILNDVKDAFRLVNKLKTKDTYVLLENDLPDLFTENKL